MVKRRRQLRQPCFENFLTPFIARTSKDSDNKSKGPFKNLKLKNEKFKIKKKNVNIEQA